MGMLFGGWAKEEEEKSGEEAAFDLGWKQGMDNGWNRGIQAAQLLVTQSECLEHAQKLELHMLLEKLKKEK